MRFTLTRDEFRRAISGAATAVPSRTPSNILRHVLIVAEDGAVWMTGSDTDNTVTVSVPCIAQQAGSACLPADKLSAIAKEAQGDVTVETAEDGRATIRSGASKWRVGALPAQEYPVLEEFIPQGTWRMDGSELERLSDRAGWSAKTGRDAITSLHSVLLELRPDRVAAFSTDALTGAYVRATADGDATADAMLMPDRLSGAATLVAGMPVTLELGANHLRLSAPSVAILLRLSEGTYPTWRKVVRDESPIGFRAERTALISALRALDVVTNDAQRHIVAEFTTDGVRMHTATIDGEADTSVRGALIGIPLTLGFNSNDALSVLSKVPADVVELRMSGPEQAIHVMGVTSDASFAETLAVDDADWLYLLMPQRGK